MDYIHVEFKKQIGIISRQKPEGINNKYKVNDKIILSIPVINTDYNCTFECVVNEVRHSHFLKNNIYKINPVTNPNVDIYLDEKQLLEMIEELNQ